MREIKFRAWDKIRQRMILPGDYDFVTFSGKPGTAYPHSIDEQPVMASLFEVHLMQYTDLKDKNGKEVFEKDILRFYWRGESQAVCAVTWNDLGCWDLGYPLSDYEVIGNIYENPELLNPPKGK